MTGPTALNYGAKGETRTLTSKIPEPKSGASTNSATFAETAYPITASHTGFSSGVTLLSWAPEFRRPEYGVDDGDRTHDNKNHNLALYQLSYAHHNMARPAGFEPATLGLAYQLRLSTPHTTSLWSGLSLHHLRCRTYSLYGTLRKQVSSGLPSAQPDPGGLLRFPRYGAIHSWSSVSPRRLLCTG